LVEVIGPLRLFQKTGQGRRRGQRVLFPEMQPRGPKRGRLQILGPDFFRSPEKPNR
jgi:hypothetical protein